MATFWTYYTSADKIKDLIKDKSLPKSFNINIKYDDSSFPKPIFRAYAENGTELTQFISQHRISPVGDNGIVFAELIGSDLKLKTVKKSLTIAKVPKTGKARTPKAQATSSTSLPKSARITAQKPATVTTTDLESLSTNPSDSNEEQTSSAVTSQFSNQLEFVSFLNDSIKLKPSSYQISEIKWKSVIRTVLRGKNLMIVGEKGEGKTTLIFAIAKALGRPLFTFNLGDTSDAQTYLFGKTQAKDGSTFYQESEFLKAITTKNAIVLLDEFSRASRDASNILFPILDLNQRFAHIPERGENSKVMVAEGVSFLATANIGMEYTGTSIMDTAIMDRFTKVEIDELTSDQLHNLIKGIKVEQSIKDFFVKSKLAIKSAVKNSDLTQTFSTRQMIECLEYCYDGFSIQEVLELMVYSTYSSDGDMQSERTFCYQLLQGFLTQNNS